MKVKTFFIHIFKAPLFIFHLFRFYGKITLYHKVLQTIILFGNFFGTTLFLATSNLRGIRKWYFKKGTKKTKNQRMELKNE